MEETERRKNLNPFADVDDDSDDGEGDGDGSFEIGDLEEDIEGRGLMDNHDNNVDDNDFGKLDKHVGIPDLASVLSFSIHSPGSPPPASNTSITGIGRATFPSLWPFGSSGNTSPKELASNNGNIVNHDKTHKNSYLNGRDTSADEIDGIQSPNEDDDSENSSDEGLDGHGLNGDASNDHRAGGQYAGKRRLSATTEAKRRTSLEDDDEDEEVVHVAMAEADAEAHEHDAKDGLEEGEGELIEVQHAIDGVGIM